MWKHELSNVSRSYKCIKYSNEWVLQLFFFTCIHWKAENVAVSDKTQSLPRRLYVMQKSHCTKISWPVFCKNKNRNIILHVFSDQFVKRSNKFHYLGSYQILIFIRHEQFSSFYKLFNRMFEDVDENHHLCLISFLGNARQYILFHTFHFYWVKSALFELRCTFFKIINRLIDWMVDYILLIWHSWRHSIRSICSHWKCLYVCNRNAYMYSMRRVFANEQYIYIYIYGFSVHRYAYYKCVVFEFI